MNALLMHLEAAGFEGSPRFLGTDDQGRQVLSFVSGEVGVRTPSLDPPAYIRSGAYLDGVARLLRRMHDSTVGFLAPGGASWEYLKDQVHGGEVMCHNDVGPYNLVCRDEGPVALIDWDQATPGAREWDIAYALYRCAPFYPDDVCTEVLHWPSAPDRQGRVALFLDAYGWDGSKAEVLAAMERRIQAMVETGLQRHAEGHLIYDATWKKVVLPRLYRDLGFVRSQQPTANGQ
jgi:hypothetical protein